MLLCENCSSEWTVPERTLHQIPGLLYGRKGLLDKLHSPKGTMSQIWSPSHFEVGVGYETRYWRPLFDSVLREATGIDLETAMAKQIYVEQLLNTTRYVARRARCSQLQRQLRRDIIVAACKLWDEEDIGDDIPKEDIRYYRSTFAPTELLPGFLFPRRKLDETIIHVPFESHTVWLPDPAQLNSWKELVTADKRPGWKIDTARRMLRQLILRQFNITAWNNAADKYHIERIRLTLTPDFARELIRQGLGQQDAHRFRRLAWLLHKLHLAALPGTKDVIPEVQLSKKGAELATNSFLRLVEASCIGCPVSGKLAPRGIVSIVRHMRISHPSKFWGKDDWMLPG